MAFEAKDLSVLAYSNGFTLWHYLSVDDATDLDANGYFNTAADMLRVGDMILANTNKGGVSQAGFYLVKNSQQGQVDTADVLAFGATNSK